MRTGRALTAMAVAVMLAGTALLSSASMAYGATPCVVRNVTQGITSGSFAEMIARAMDGDILHVGGTCPGSAIIESDLLIRGVGQRPTLIGGPRSRSVKVAREADVSLQGVVIRGGRAPRGGGILNLGTLRLIDVVVVGNTAAYPLDAEATGEGGGIYNRGQLRLGRTRVADNRAGTGGGIVNAKGADLRIIGSTVERNRAERGGTGGGLRNRGSLFLDRSEVVGNLAEEGGGGIHNEGDLRMRRSAIRGNDTSYNGPGGGILNEASGTGDLRRSVLEGNRAAYAGGGLDNAGSMVLRGTTIRDNRSKWGAGGLHNSWSLTLERSNVLHNATRSPGGGIGNEGALTITGSRVRGNSARRRGGGLDNVDQGTVALGPATRIRGNDPDECAGVEPVCPVWMTPARDGHAATLLAEGRVLLVGGLRIRSPQRVAELVDASTSAIGPAAAMMRARGYATATTLTDGRVLVAGGQGRTQSIGAAELYHPATARFAWTANLGVARTQHQATLLSDGRVLVTGGIGDRRNGPARLDSAELYDPTTGTFMATGPMTIGRVGHSATLLREGRVLVAGAYRQGGASAELYDARAGTFTATGSMMTPRGGHSATLLADGRVLLSGGHDGHVPVAAAEIYDPRLGTFVPTGPMTTPREGHTATLLESGQVLVAGGVTEPGDGLDQVLLASTELYDAATGTFSSSQDMTRRRAGHTATLLPDGRLLLAGGASAEFIHPSDLPAS